MKRILQVGLFSIVCCAVIDTAYAQVVRQQTDLRRTVTTLAGLDDAGDSAFAFSSTDPFGVNPDHEYRLVRRDPATGAGSQVTAMQVRPDGYGPEVSDDGQRIVFASWDDPLGTNPANTTQLFRIDADGMGMVQLTPAAGAAEGDIGHFALSGNGARVVFESNADYFGTNPTRVGQLYVVESDGSGLRQITNHALDDLYLMWPTISDDGVRIAYSSINGVVNFDWQLFGILHDGSARRQITFDPLLQPLLPKISGDGSTIAFETQSPTLQPPPGGCWGSPGQQIALVNWDGTDLHLVTGVCLGAVYPGVARTPDITDDAQLVFYAANEFEAWRIHRVNRDGTARMLLTDLGGQPGPSAACDASRAAGGGGRVSYWCSGGEPWGGPNPDLSRETYAMTGTGTGHRQLSSDVDGDSLDPDLTPDGASLVFVSDANPLDEPGYWHSQIYRMAPDGSGLARVTVFNEGVTKHPSTRDDGSVIVFAHDGDPLGTNGYRSFEIFAVNADGTGLTQLTPDTEGSFEPKDSPELSGDGRVVVFQESGYNGWKVYRVNPDGSGLLLLSPEGSSIAPPRPRVDATGAWVVYAWEGQIRRQGSDGSMDQTLTTLGGAEWPDVEAGGGHVVYASSADPLDTNPEGNVELFLWKAAGGTTRQLTSTASGDSTIPSFDRAGSWVWFWSDAPHLGEEQPGYFTPFRVHRTTGQLERVGGLSACVAEELSPGQRGPDTLRPIPVGAAGRLAALGTWFDCTGDNDDGSGEIIVIDLDAPPRITVSPGPVPTVVSWDVESGPVRYDVIRGDVAALSIAAGQVDLGTVDCVENDSYDASTIGNEDASAPLPGQAFFYLYRGSQGATAGPGSYGAASSSEERLPAAGDCPI